jgi:hypothetical protein
VATAIVAARLAAAALSLTAGSRLLLSGWRLLLLLLLASQPSLQITQSAAKSKFFKKGEKKHVTAKYVMRYGRC